MIGEAMELQTLVEEDETIEQLPLEQETQYSSSLDHTTQWGDHVTIDTPTLLDNQDKHVLMTHSDDDDEALNRNSLRNSLMSDSTGSNRVSTFNVSCKNSFIGLYLVFQLVLVIITVVIIITQVPRQDSLSSFTKDEYVQLSDVSRCITLHNVVMIVGHQYGVTCCPLGMTSPSL